MSAHSRRAGWSGLAAGFAALALVAVAPAGDALAQPAGLNPSRDCQTVRTCNFSRSGAVRGCLSSYTCRTCKMVRARCEVGGRTNCQQVVCSWGG